MVKRILSICLLLIYTTASSGVVLNTHFCMGDYAGVSIVENDYSDQCPKCGMKDMGCCHDVPQVLKIDNGAFTAPYALSFSSIAEIPVQLNHYVRPAFSKNHSTYYLDTQVVDASPPIYILNCVFRI
ncbi:MAG: HYC_CC_PP family protein [Chitinophagaceae bacterium]